MRLRAAAAAMAALCIAGSRVAPPGEGGGAEAGTPPAGTASHGAAIYLERGCPSCHAATLEHDALDLSGGGGNGGEGGPIRAGHPLEGAAHRGTWWGGRITTDAAEAADFCRQAWLETDGEEFSAQERKALVLFMQSLGVERGISPLVLLRRDAGDVDLRGGDPGRGRALYARACGACHPGGPGEARRLMGVLSPAQVAEVVRKGTGRMPFFQVDRLAAGQVADIAAYMESLRVAAPP